MTQRTMHIAALLAVLIGVAGCAEAQPNRDVATPTPLPTPIVPTKPTYQVQRGEVVDKLDFTGRIAPVIEEELFFRTGGYVDVVYVKRNDEVQAGDILAELEVTDLKNQLAQAEAALEATVSSNEQQVAEAEANLATAELRLAQLEADDPRSQEIIAGVRLEFSQLGLEDAQEYRQQILDQPWLRDPVKALEGADRVVHDAELNLRIAQAEYQRARQATLVHGYNIQIQEQEVASARLRLERLESGFDVEEIRLTVERLRAQLADARITAPFDGRVLSMSLVEGRLVDGYKAVVIVADPSELEVSADVPDRLLRDLSEGMVATAAPVAVPGAEIEAEIRRLPYPYGGGGRSEGVGEEDKSTRVTLDMAAAGDDIELGDLVRVTVVLERKEDVLWLPPQAIRLFEGRKFVVLQDDEAQRRVDVKVGIEGEDRVEIEDGLTEGQVVIGQ